jgi:hypothetical protein
MNFLKFFGGVLLTLLSFIVFFIGGINAITFGGISSTVILSSLGFLMLIGGIYAARSGIR